MNIGFIGLGVMGQSMAGHLLASGAKLHVYNRSPAKAEALLERGAVWEASVRALAESCEVIFTILGFPRDVEEVYLGKDGLVAHARRGSLLVDMTTSSPELAVRIAEAGSVRGIEVLDAPVSGGDRGAREGSLSIMAGGEKSAFERARPFFQLMGKNIVYQGAAGSGQHCKMCNQITIASTMIGVCEALAYAERSGLDPQTVLQSISAGAAGSWTLSNLAPRMLAGDFAPGFFVKHFLKDMGIAAEEASGRGLDLPGLNLALSRYRELSLAGQAEAGTQALYRLYAQTGQEDEDE